MSNNEAGASLIVIIIFSLLIAMGAWWEGYNPFWWGLAGLIVSSTIIANIIDS